MVARNHWYDCLPPNKTNISDCIFTLYFKKLLPGGLDVLANALNTSPLHIDAYDTCPEELFIYRRNMPYLSGAWR